MAFSIEWKLEGDKQLSRRLRRVASTVQDLREPFKKSARQLQSIYENDVFRTRGGAIDERWKRLSPATVARKARSGQSSRPLIGTGRMRDSFRHKVGRDHATIWNYARYFKFHQSNRPRSKLPRRVMMKLAEAQRRVVVRIFQKFLRQEINRP